MGRSAASSAEPGRYLERLHCDGARRICTMMARASPASATPPPAPGGDRVRAVAVSSATLDTPLGALQLFATERGLLAVGLPGAARDALEAYLRRALGPTA